MLPRDPRGSCARGLSLINVVGDRKPCRVCVCERRSNGNFRGEEKEEREGGAAEAEPAGAVTGGGRAGAGAARCAAV